MNFKLITVKHKIRFREYTLIYCTLTLENILHIAIKEKQFRYFFCKLLILLEFRKVRIQI